MRHDALFTWVHLADIHRGFVDPLTRTNLSAISLIDSNHGSHDSLVLDALLQDLKALVVQDGLKPDAIFVTGDIAFSGAVREADEYTRAETWLTKMAHATGVPVEQVYVVPGNHDVQHPVDETLAAKNWLSALRHSQNIDKALIDTGARHHHSKRLESYLTFAAKWSPAGRPDTRGPRLYWQHRIAAKGGLCVRVCGLNTALLAADEETFGTDRGRLALGKLQVVETLAKPRPSEDEVVLVLSHHPFTNHWLRDQAQAVGWMSQYAHVHLSGHMHEGSSSRAIEGRGNDFVHLAAGAVHGEHDGPLLARYAYNVCALVREGTSVALRVWPRTWTVGTSEFDRDTALAGGDLGYVQFPLPRVQLSPLASRRAAPLSEGPLSPREPPPTRDDRPMHEWPPSWASAWGEDRFGMWAAFSVGDVLQRMRWIAPGRFTMGSPNGELGRYKGEALHEVLLTQGYWLGETPVTQALWRAVMGTSPSTFRGDRRPVEHVTWDDAVAFCATMNVRVSDVTLSLPTEAEWEYACRAGTSTATWNGDLSDHGVAPELDGIAWYAANSHRETHNVGEKRANPWGLHDMLGNVWEWCADAFSDLLRYAIDPLMRGERGALRVRRGGSWGSDARDVRAAIRFAGEPDHHHENLGFRVAIGRASRP